MGRRSSFSVFAQSDMALLRRLAVAGMLLTALLVSGCTHDSPHVPSHRSTPYAAPTAAPTTPVPAPGGGSVEHTAKAASPTTQSPVDLSETATIPKVLKASIQHLTGTTVKAQGPGEISGPGVAVSLQVTNTSSAALKLGSVSVTMTDSSGKPCTYVPVSQSHPLTGVLAPGKSATGVYVFTIATNKRSPIRIGLIYGPSTSVLRFTGTVR